MALELQRNEEGGIVEENGNPVYVHRGTEGVEDGTKVVWNATEIDSTMRANRKESQTQRQAREAAEAAHREAETKLKQFEGIEPDKAREALQQISSGNVVDEAKLKELREQMGADYSKREAELKAAAEAEREALSSRIFRLTVSTRFAQSTFIREKLLLPPDIAESTFGRHFKTEVDENGNEVTKAYTGEGELIYSEKQPGKIADFEEAIEILVNAYPNKASILKGANLGGSGAQGNGEGSDSAIANPWLKSSLNLTEQGRLMKENPSRAKALKAEAERINATKANAA